MSLFFSFILFSYLRPIDQSNLWLAFISLYYLAKLYSPEHKSFNRELTLWTSLAVRGSGGSSNKTIVRSEGIAASVWFAFWFYVHMLALEKSKYDRYYYLPRWENRRSEIHNFPESYFVTWEEVDILSPRRMRAGCAPWGLWNGGIFVMDKKQSTDLLKDVCDIWTNSPKLSFRVSLSSKYGYCSPNIWPLFVGQPNIHSRFRHRLRMRREILHQKRSTC